MRNSCSDHFMHCHHANILKLFITAVSDALQHRLQIQLCEKKRSLFSSCPVTHSLCIHICMHHKFIPICFIYHILSYTVSAFLERSEVYLCACENVLCVSYNPALKFISQIRHFTGSFKRENFLCKHHRKFIILKKILTLIHDPLHKISCLQNGRDAIKIA